MDSSTARCGAQADEIVKLLKGCCREQGHDAASHGFRSDEVETFVPPAQVAAGMIAALANLVPTKGALLFTIARSTTAGELVVSFVPPAPEDDHAPQPLPLQLAGTPDELDAALAESLATYVPATATIYATAEEIASQSKSRAEKARADADKRADANRPKPKTGTLTVTTTPTTATIVAEDAKNAKHDLKSGKKATLEVGKYSITVSAADHTTVTTTITIAANGAEERTIALEPATPDLFAETK